MNNQEEFDLAVIRCRDAVRQGRKDALAPIKAVYERYRHLDTALCDTRQLAPTGYSISEYRHLAAVMWQAIRTACEEKGDG